MVLFLKDCLAHVDQEAYADIYTIDTYSEWWIGVTGDLKHIRMKSWSVYV